MPFSLSNAPASFQSYINKILVEKLDIFILVYLNNILIHIKNLKQSHVEVMQWVLKQLRKYDLYANQKKCWFHKNEIWFLDFVVSTQSLKIEEKKSRL